MHSNECDGLFFVETGERDRSFFVPESDAMCRNHRIKMQVNSLQEKLIFYKKMSDIMIMDKSKGFQGWISVLLL